MVPASAEFFSAVREVCDETGALMMVDEVQARLGRCYPLAVECMFAPESSMGFVQTWSC